EVDVHGPLGLHLLLDGSDGLVGVLTRVAGETIEVLLGLRQERVVAVEQILEEGSSLDAGVEGLVGDQGGIVDDDEVVFREGGHGAHRLLRSVGSWWVIAPSGARVNFTMRSPWLISTMATASCQSSWSSGSRSARCPSRTYRA